MAEILKNITVQTSGGQSVEFTNPLYGLPIYDNKATEYNYPPSFTYFDINSVFSSSNPAGPRDIPINSYCSAYGSILAGFNNSLFTLDSELEYNVFQITNLSTLTHNRSKIYILNAEEKQFYVADFRTSSGSVFYYDLSPKNYMPLPSTATSGDFLVYNGSEWAAQTVPAANGNNF